MVLFLVFGIVVLALLLMPEVFAALWQTAIENPGPGIGLLAVLVLVLVWTYKR